MKTIDFTRINNDLNGNPRVVCHFFNLLTDDEVQKHWFINVLVCYVLCLIFY